MTLYSIMPRIFPTLDMYLTDQDQILFLMAMLQFLLIVTIATLLYKMCKYFPLALYTYLFITAKGYGTVYAILALYWLLTKIWYRGAIEEKPPQRTEKTYEPYDYKYIGQQISNLTKPMEKKEREVFLQCIPLIEMTILFAAGAAIVVSGNKSCFPLLAVIVVVIVARSIPSVGGNSTAGVITMMMVFVFSIMMVGPHIYVQWAEALGWEKEPPMEKTMVVTEDIATQGWMIWDTITDSLFQRIGLALNYAKLSDVFRCFLGLFALAYLLVDEWFGPGEGIMSMVRVRLKDVNNKQYGLVGMFKSLNWLGLVAELGFCFVTGNYTKLLVGTLAIFVAGGVWAFFGKHIWRGRGMVATQVEARTDTMMVFGDGPTGARTFICRGVAVMTLVAYFLNNGPANGFGLLMIMLIPALKSERMLALFIGFVTANMTMVTMGLLGKKPINSTLSESAQPAADPTYGANSRSNLEDDEGDLKPRSNKP